MCRYGLGLVCYHLSRADAVFLFGAFFFFLVLLLFGSFTFFFRSVSMVDCKLVMLLLIVYLPVLY